MLAPIALFVYNRPMHTRRTLEALRRNREAAESELFIFSDSPKNECAVDGVAGVRDIIKNVKGFRNICITERNKNYGLAMSIIEGVNGLCEEYGRIIVLEDDLLVSPHFLTYMNTALDRYEPYERVMQISGHMFPVKSKTDTDTVFLPFTTSWGWAVWQRAWKHFDPHMSGYEKLCVDPSLRQMFDLDGSYPYFDMLEAQKNGKIDSWAIRWYLSVFMNGGLTLFPVRTLVKNIGFDCSGTHCGKSEKQSSIDLDFSVRRYPERCVNNEFKKAVFDYFSRSQKDSKISFIEKLRVLSKNVVR